MNNELLTILEYIEQERGINREVLVDAVEKALLSASRKSIHPASELDIKIDRKTGEIKAWARLEVVESIPNNDQIVIDRAREKFPNVQVGEKIQWEVTPRNFGRIAAQTAKQAIMMQLRKAEKVIVKEEFQEKVGEIVNGEIRRFESGNIIIDLHKAEGIIPSRERVNGEQYVVGDRINALLVKVDTAGSGPSLILSRATPNFVKKLFEREVTEIHDGIVEIMGVARDPGNRSKISVRSKNPSVDPIGACVGMRGMRVRNITQELNGERIDIVRYEDDIRAYATEALQPAKPKSIALMDNKRALLVKVTADQSKLAFGKRGQNVRLAAKLLGYAITIEVEGEEGKEESFESRKEKVITSLSEILGISSKTAGILVNNGFLSVEELKAVDSTEILSLEGIDEEEAGTVISALKEIGG